MALFDPSISGMGIGSVGLGDPNLTLKKKFRWTFEVTGPGQYVPPYFCKAASRPSFSMEETQIDFLNAKAFVPGKVTWEEMTVTFLDAAGSIQGQPTEALYNWIARSYNFTNYINNFMNSKRSAYTSQILINLYDGCGSVVEYWMINDAWVKNAKFGELMMESNDNVEVELTLRFSQVRYYSVCPSMGIGNNCEPCYSS